MFDEEPKFYNKELVFYQRNDKMLLCSSTIIEQITFGGDGHYFKEPWAKNVIYI